MLNEGALGEGASGCVLFPAMECAQNQMTALLNDSLSEQCTAEFYKTHASKIIPKNHVDTANEIAKNDSVNKVDPDGQFHIMTKYKCQPQRTEATFDKIKDCMHHKKLGSEGTLDAFSTNNILLMMPNGGIHLDKWVMNPGSLDETLQVLIDAYRIMRGLYDLNNASKCIIHGDVLPINILYDKISKRLNLIDFGNSVYSSEILEAKENGPAFIHGKTEGFAPEWHVLMKGENLFKKVQSTSDISQFIDPIRKSEYGKRLCTAIYRATTSRISKNAYINDNDVTDKKISEVDNYWRNFQDMLSQTQSGGISYETFLKEAIPTFDVYGMGYTMLNIVGRLRETNYFENKEHPAHKVYDTIIALCLKAINSNVRMRLSWADFFSQYEAIFINHKIYKTTSIVSSDPQSLSNSNTGNGSLEDQIWKHIKKPLLSKPTRSIAEINDGNSEIFTHLNSEDLKPEDLLKPLCEHYINKLGQRYEIKTFFRLDAVPAVYTTSNNTISTDHLILTNLGDDTVVVLWHHPNKVAWLWDFDENQKNDSNENEIQTRLSNVLGNGFSLDGYEIVRHVCNSSMETVLQKSIPENATTEMKSLIRLTGALALTVVACRFCIVEEKELSGSVLKIARLIRDRGALNLSSMLNSFFDDQNEVLPTFDITRGILLDLFPWVSDLVTSNVGDYNVESEVAPYIEKLVYYFHAPFHLDTIPETFCVFTLSEVNTDQDDNEKGSAYNNKISFIAEALRNEKELTVKLFFPESAASTELSRQKSILHVYIFKFDMKSKTLYVTTPRSHIFEVARPFVRVVLQSLTKKLVHDDNDNINVIRVAQNDFL